MSVDEERSKNARCRVNRKALENRHFERKWRPESLARATPDRGSDPYYIYQTADVREPLMKYCCKIKKGGGHWYDDSRSSTSCLHGTREWISASEVDFSKASCHGLLRKDC